MLVHDLIYYRYPIQGKHLEPNSKTGKIDILFKDRNPVKNHTLLGGKTPLPNTYMGVPPPPPGHPPSANHSTSFSMQQLKIGTVFRSKLNQLPLLSFFKFAL